MRVKAFVLVCMHAFACAVASMLAFVLTLMTTVIISVAGESDVAIPGLVHTRPGLGAELASTDISPGAFLYPTGFAIVLFAAVRLAHSHRRADRAPERSREG